MVFSLGCTDIQHMWLFDPHMLMHPFSITLPYDLLYSKVEAFRVVSLKFMEPNLGIARRSPSNYELIRYSKCKVLTFSNPIQALTLLSNNSTYHEPINQSINIRHFRNSNIHY